MVKTGAFLRLRVDVNFIVSNPFRESCKITLRLLNVVTSNQPYLTLCKLCDHIMYVCNKSVGRGRSICNKVYLTEKSGKR